MSKKKQLVILGLSYSQTQSGAYALVLAEEDGKRRIPIIIGGAEAQAIAFQLENLQPIRPLTHDLFMNFATAFGVRIIEVNIYKLNEGIFYSELVCDGGKEILKIDARTSDAIALALRFKCPIFTTEEVLSKAGIVLDIDEDKVRGRREEDFDEDDPSGMHLSRYTKEELEEMLQEAIEEENYEDAGLIRDEINLRKEDEDDDEEE